MREPCAASCLGSGSRVCPRECGGNRRGVVRTSLSQGLSPRMRGNPAQPVEASGGDRSIPASAGEPASRTMCPRAVSVYPGECGGTTACASFPSTIESLSPRVRGESRPTHRDQCYARVYPRECGGTLDTSSVAASPSGLSPRVRGNLGRIDVHHRRGGSIPASAGEPSAARVAPSSCKVYPRECGGTFDECLTKRC